MVEDNEVNVEDWLEDWVEENINSPGYHDDKSAMKQEADLCELQAKEAGISKEQLSEATYGDIQQYLLDKQNALTDEHIERQTEKD